MYSLKKVTGIQHELGLMTIMLKKMVGKDLTRTPGG